MKEIRYFLSVIMKKITNRTLSDLLDVAMTGCVSHRFNLAVKNYLKDYGITLQKTHELMKKTEDPQKSIVYKAFHDISANYS